MIASLAGRAFRLMAAAPVEGSLVEFGVYQGGGLSMMASLAKKHLGGVPPLFGFDTFAGMPTTEEPLEHALEAFWAPGTFADTSVEGVRARLRGDGVEATLVPAVFGDLPPLSELGVGNVRFAHIDADIYEGYRDALRLLTPHLGVGSVVLFDESWPPNEWRYQSVRDHGWRAVREWEDETGFNLHVVRFSWTGALNVIVDEDYLRRHWRAIDRARKDTIEESVRNIVRIVLDRELEERVHLDSAPRRRRVLGAMRTRPGRGGTR